MAAFEGSQKNMLQGVSQQLQRERLEGQVSAQTNMLSDLVTGVRRRPGAELRTVWDVENIALVRRIRVWDGDISNTRVKCLLNGVNGVLRICDEAWTVITEIQDDYFIFTDRKEIQHTVTGDRIYILNKTKVPTIATTTAGATSDTKGYFFIKTGAFSTAYTITITDTAGYIQNVTYTTPPATDAGAAAASTPEYIATQLYTPLTTATKAQVGAYVFLSNTTGLTVTTSQSSSYVGVSGTQYTAQVSDLPARLPTAANEFTMAVGAAGEPTYFKYNSARTLWQEGPKEGSAATLADMPKYVSKIAGVWTLGSTYEGRLAGDDTSNPNPAFLGYGIDGIGSFQGRLVLLNGSKVNMSASGKPGRFWRSTIETILVSDPIEVGASANSSAAYQYCVPFNKDLLLYSEKYQALVPGSNAIVGPANATVVVTSSYEADMTSAPLSLGRTVMFPAPRSMDFFGLLEMLPSPYTDSQYVSTDVTAHLPKYLSGRCRWSVSSSVAGIALFASSIDLRTLVVHEYTWDADAKVQQAWHKWTFPYDIADACFTGSDVNLVFVNNGNILHAVIDPRIGTLTAQGERRPFLDLYSTVTVVREDDDPTVGGTVTIPETMLAFDPDWAATCRLAERSLELLGEEVGVDSRTTDTLVTVPSIGAGEVSMGISYRSSVSPSMPAVKDANGVVISANKLTLLRFMIGTSNSYEYEAVVSDSGDDSASMGEDMSTLYWGSADLELGDPRISVESTAILPCRTQAASTVVLLSTDGLGEFNIISLEYVCRYNQKLKRR